mmetsp:Transcript_15676/g.49231  ORF Transcript_15676/g.49231 Transcript_15676/m.49231 type:complete len:205 (-) Transcript_15676:263-877(-)
MTVAESSARLASLAALRFLARTTCVATSRSSSDTMCEVPTCGHLSFLLGALEIKCSMTFRSYTIPFWSCTGSSRLPTSLPDKGHRVFFRESPPTSTSSSSSPGMASPMWCTFQTRFWNLLYSGFAPSSPPSAARKAATLPSISPAKSVAEVPWGTTYAPATSCTALSVALILPCTSASLMADAPRAATPASSLAFSVASAASSR